MGRRGDYPHPSISQSFVIKNVRVLPMAKPELGMKRLCPVTGRKFYDLNRDPIVSPYTGQAYARSVFEPQVKAAAAPEADEDEDETPEAAANVELVALEEADADAGAVDPVAADPNVDVDVDDDLAADDDADVFVEEDEDEDDDVADLIDGDLEDDEET
jgi:uncharacterized protein (TIGR02300 family)